VRLNISNKHTSALQVNQVPAVLCGGMPKETADIANAHKAGDSALVVAYTQNFKGVDTNISPTLRDSNKGSGSNTLVGARRLTPLECERLQGFPDSWTAVNGMSDSARYRMLGNAVAVPVAEWLGKRIIDP
jgi:DNA (cytosine-5)-methyltransferase 1